MHKVKLLLLLIGMSLHAIGQIDFRGGLNDLNYDYPKEYEIAGITLSGSENLDKNVVELISGLKVGQRIKVPGEEITKAITNLSKQNLFDEIAISAAKVKGDKIWLDFYLKELPRLTKFSFRGVKKSKVDDIRDLIQLNRGKVVNDNLIINTKNKIRDYYVDKGNLNATVEIEKEMDPDENNGMILHIKIDEGQRVKVNDIIFHGMSSYEEQKLRKSLKNTKKKSAFNVFKSSKFIREEYEEDKKKLIAFYNKEGHRDMRIIKDTVYSVSPEAINIEITIDEGRKYYFRNISFLGNEKFIDQELYRMLNVEKGDVYDRQLLDSRLYMSMEGTDISSFYMDDGYLFFDIRPVEVYAIGDSIDLEIRIREGNQARINNITIKGNTRTNDHVVLRTLRTRPGQLFSRSDIQRTIRELSQLGYFDPEQIGVNPVPDPETGMVDIEYTLVEKSTSQIELQGGWGGNRIVGTFGVVFDNFSARNILKKGGWRPLPQGDGQRLSLRAQTNGRFFQSYNASFTEPWLGGKKPTSFTLSGYHSIQSNGLLKGDVDRQAIKISGISVGLGNRLKWPDDYFTLYQGLNFQFYNLENYSQTAAVFQFTNGTSRAFSYKFVLGRNSVDNPIYPRAGSNFSWTLQLTPPCSLLKPGLDYSTLPPAIKYECIEYHKWKFDAAWYTRIVGDLVFKVGGNWGFLGKYNDDYGYSPFERFYLGGDGLQGFVLDGREVISQRGYPNGSLSPPTGAVSYEKITFELRYPITLNPNSTIYGLAFFEMGNSWGQLEEFDPFDLKRGTGGGVRIFMPMFGMLGVDFGYGFDPIFGGAFRSGWQTHFILGQQF